MDNDNKGAGVKFPPPLIFLTVILAGYWLDRLLPLSLSDSDLVEYIGVLDVLGGLIVILLASRNFSQAKTHIEPWKPTTTILSTGIFGYSRNPIYLAFCLIQVGLALILNTLWILLGVLVSAFLVYHIAIKKEEAYLEEKFGEDYIQYKKTVRRWL